MKMALAMLAVFATLATLVTIIATVLVLAAFGLGKALSLVLPFSVFEASLLSMLAMWPALWAVWRIVTSGQNDDIQQAWADEQDEDDEEEEEEESFDEEHDEGEGVAWAVPLRPVISPPQIGRNSPCPCGSGRKYKRCCGKADGPARKADEPFVEFLARTTRPWAADPGGHAWGGRWRRRHHSEAGSQPSPCPTQEARLVKC